MTRGNQLGQNVASALMGKFLSYEIRSELPFDAIFVAAWVQRIDGIDHCSVPSPALEFASSQVRRQRMLAVARAMLESAAP
jgi:hypothetical protein